MGAACSRRNADSPIGNAANGTRLRAASGTTKIRRAPRKWLASGSHVASRSRLPLTRSGRAAGRAASADGLGAATSTRQSSISFSISAVVESGTSATAPSSARTTNAASDRTGSGGAASPAAGRRLRAYCTKEMSADRAGERDEPPQSRWAFAPFPCGLRRWTGPTVARRLPCSAWRRRVRRLESRLRCFGPEGSHSVAAHDSPRREAPRAAGRLAPSLGCEPRVHPGSAHVTG